MIVRKGETTRRELYDAIWSKSIHRTAQQFGIAPLTLASLCRKHEIPLPPKGFANRRIAGHSAPRPPLPVFPGQRRNLVETFGEPTKRIQLQGRKSDGTITLPIPIVTSGQFSHPLIKRTRRFLARAKPDDAGILVSEQGLVEHLKVSRKALPRALRILNALFVAFDESPFNLNWPDNSSAKLTIAVLGECFRFSMIEIIDSKRHTPSVPVHVRQKIGSSPPPKWDFAPTSRLQLVIEAVHGHRLRCIWSDVTLRPLEVCLHGFLDALVGLAQALNRERLGRGNWRLKWDRQREHEKETAAKQAEIARKSSVLDRALVGWENANKTLQFLAVRVSARAVDDNTNQQPCSHQLFLWIEQQADNLNPLQDVSQLISEFKNPVSDD